MNERVYVQTNDAERNEVIAFERAADGRLSPLGSYETGGRGTGKPHLASQSSVVLSDDGTGVLVANAGSDDLSLFAVEPDGLRLVGRVAAGVDPGSAGILGQLGGRMVRAGAWDQLGGMIREKELIERQVILPLAHPQLAERLGLVPPRAIVLFGPPGTGKTTFAMGAASRLGWPFVELFPSRLAGESRAHLHRASLGSPPPRGRDLVPRRPPGGRGEPARCRPA